ncbi:hypothetical protein FOZ62_031798, partial [Perkinsus olseni]
RTTKFTALIQLSLDSNHIKCISVLPPNLRILNVCGNQINSVEGPELPTLLHLGLAYNKVEDAGAIAERFPSLLSLDLSYNRICGLSKTVEAFKNSAEIRRLLLCGNPLSLTPAYRPSIVRDLPSTFLLPVFALQVYPKLFEGVPHTVADEGGGYFVTIRDMQGTQIRSPTFVRDAPPPVGSGADTQGDDDDERPEEMPPTWPVAMEGAEDQATSEVEECLPELVQPTEDNADEAPTEGEQTGSPDGDEVEKSEEPDEMARHITEGHCAVSTAAIRVPLFSSSEATTGNPVAAPSPRPDPSCGQMCLALKLKAWTPQHAEVEGDDMA